MAIINDPALKKGISALASGGKKNSKQVMETTAGSGSQQDSTLSQQLSSNNDWEQRLLNAYGSGGSVDGFDYSNLDALYRKNPKAQTQDLLTQFQAQAPTPTSQQYPYANSGLVYRIPNSRETGLSIKQDYDYSQFLGSSKHAVKADPDDFGGHGGTFGKEPSQNTPSLKDLISGLLNPGGAGSQVPNMDVNLKWLPKNAEWDIDWFTGEYLKDNLKADDRIKELLKDAINANGLALGKGINDAMHQKRLNAQTANTTGENVGAQNARDVQDTLATIQGVNSENQANIDKYMDVRRELAKDQANFTERGMNNAGNWAGMYNNAVGMIGQGLYAAQVNAQSAAQQIAAGLYQTMLDKGMIDINGNVLSETPADNSTLSIQDFTDTVNGAQSELELLAMLGNYGYSDAQIEAATQAWKEADPIHRMDAAEYQTWWNSTHTKAKSITLNQAKKAVLGGKNAEGSAYGNAAAKAIATALAPAAGQMLFK